MKFLFFTIFSQICFVKCIEILSTNSSVYVEENKSVNLTCSIDNNETTFLSFIKNGKRSDPVILVIRNGACKQYDNLTVYCDHNTQKFIYEVSNTNIQNGDTWECSDYIKYSNNITIIVIEPITSVTMLKIGEPNMANAIDIDENATEAFTCKTSSRPAAQILWMIVLKNGTEKQLSVFNPSEKHPNVNITQTETSFNYTAKIEDNQGFILCKAKLTFLELENSPKSSRNVSLSINYPPSSNPEVDNNGNLVVRDGGEINITCLVFGGNPLANISWTCKGEPAIAIVSKNDTSIWSKLILKVDPTFNRRTCVCYSHHRMNYDRNVTTHLNVTFPSFKNVTVTSIPDAYINVSSIVNITCQAFSGNPLATITWDCGDINVTPVDKFTEDRALSSISLTAKKEYNNKTCTCIASHLFWNDPVKTYKRLIIYYVPDSSIQITGYSNDTVFYEDAAVNFVCSVHGGNPLASLEFRCLDIVGINNTNESMASAVINTKLNRTFNAEKCTCVACHILLPTCLETAVVLTIYYPPGTPHLTFSPELPVFEGDDVNVYCNASVGFPQKTTYTWYLNGTEVIKNSTTLNLGIVQKEDNHHQIKCRVDNAFTEYKHMVIASNSSAIIVEYYPRFGDNDNNLTTSEGKTVNTTCEAFGNPTPVVQWHFNGTSVSNHSILILKDIKRNQQGIYNCTALAISEKKGRLERSHVLEIFVNYAPDVSVIVRKNDSSMVLICKPEGQPAQYTFYGWQQEFNDKVIRLNNEFQRSSDDSQLYLDFFNYNDTGNYSCKAGNNIQDRNGHQIQIGSRYLNITGSPMRIPNTPYVPIFTAEEQGNFSAKIGFFTVPNVTSIEWFNMSSNTLLTKSDDLKISMEPTILQTTFYGKSVNLTQFSYLATFELSNFDKYSQGSYILMVSNENSATNFTFKAHISGPPNPLNNVTQIGSSVSTITFYLIPGLNGGHRQVFHILYHKIGQNSTTTHKQYDDQETIHQNVTVDGLHPSSTYLFTIFASNIKGNSSSKTIQASTDDQTDITFTGSTALSTGSVVGITVGIAVGLILVILFTVKRLRSNSAGDDEKTRINMLDEQRNDECELQDNILYVSADESSSKESNRSVAYAVVNKSVDQSSPSEHKFQVAPLYADVDRTKKHTKAKASVKTAKVDAESRLDIYENVIEQSEKNGTLDKQVNKDGLVYAELIFNDNHKKKGKFVIRGIENRTNYADIDLNLKADPPHSDDDEGEKKEENSEAYNEM